MKKTIAAGLASDPRIAQAKRLLLDTIADHQRNITGIRPPDTESKKAYEELLAEFEQVTAAPPTGWPVTEFRSLPEIRPCVVCAWSENANSPSKSAIDTIRRATVVRCRLA